MSKTLFILKTHLSSLFAFLAVAGTCTAFANQLAFEVGQSVNGFNTAFVSVTICNPGTSICKTIDRIKLDTGSEGLKVLKSALQGLDLPIEHDVQGNEIALCADMGGGNGYWGPLASADLVLGDEPAKGASIQIVDSSYPSRAAKCAPVFDADGRNGIIGMDTAISAPNGKTYFACGANNCSATTIGKTQQLLNPVTYIAKDNNGFTVRMPNVPSTGLTNVTGLVIFGVGTQANNQPRHTLTTCHVRQDDFFQLKYDGKEYWTKFDTGTISYNLPSEIVNVPFCQNSNVYLCPPQPVSYKVDLINFDGSECSSLNIEIAGDVNGPYSHANSWVLPGLGESWGSLISKSFILGMPFFFGKEISYVLDGAQSPLGPGPLVAF